MSSPQFVVFLHGLGEGPDSWDSQRTALPAGYEAVVIDVFAEEKSSGASVFSFERAATLVVQQLDRLGIERAHLCGLSLGAMIALHMVFAHPERVRSLTLAAGQVRPPRVLMAVQSAVIRMLPSSIVARQGATKKMMLAVLRTVGRVDFSDRLSSVSVPTLVLCGSKDHPNLPAARQLAQGIRDAQLQIIPGAGHQSHVEAPEKFSRALRAFLAGVMANEK